MSKHAVRLVIYDEKTGEQVETLSKGLGLLGAIRALAYERPGGYIPAFHHFAIELHNGDEWVEVTDDLNDSVPCNNCHGQEVSQQETGEGDTDK